MHAKKDDLDKLFDSPDFVVRGKEMGEMHVSYESFPKEFDGRAVFSSLPDGLCPVEHWGYVLKGSYRVTFRDGEEVYNEGEVYYIPPGHVPFVKEGTELLEFSPRAAYAGAMAKVAAQQGVESKQ